MTRQLNNFNIENGLILIQFPWIFWDHLHRLRNVKKVRSINAVKNMSNYFKF